MFSIFTGVMKSEYADITITKSNLEKPNSRKNLVIVGNITHWNNLLTAPA